MALKDEMKMTTVHEGSHLPLMFFLCGCLIAGLAFLVLGF